jgi:putative lipoic acid-binding regulatory protein
MKCNVVLDRGIMGKLELKYPCDWNYTVIGLDETLLRDAIAVVFRDKEYTIECSKKSKAGKYISLIVKTKTISEDDRVKQFAALAKYQAIKIVL